MMKLTPELKEIARQVKDDMYAELADMTDTLLLAKVFEEFAERFLAELPQQEQEPAFVVGNEYGKCNLPIGTKLYTSVPIYTHPVPDYKEVAEKLLIALRKVVKISNRNHEAWDNAHEAITLALFVGLNEEE